MTEAQRSAQERIKTLEGQLQTLYPLKPVDTVREALGTGTGKGAMGVAATVAAAAAIAPLLQTLGSLPQWTAIALIAASAVVALAVILVRRTKQ